MHVFNVYSWHWFKVPSILYKEIYLSNNEEKNSHLIGEKNSWTKFELNGWFILRPKRKKNMTFLELICEEFSIETKLKIPYTNWWFIPNATIVDSFQKVLLILAGFFLQRNKHSPIVLDYYFCLFYSVFFSHFGISVNLMKLTYLRSDQNLIFKINCVWIFSVAMACPAWTKSNWNDDDSKCAYYIS